MPPARKKKEPDPAPSFEEAVEELDVITRRLEQEPKSLEELVADFERGQALLTFCQSTLKSARKRLEIVEAEIAADEDPEFDDDVRLL